jgi:hypothetical protein
LGNSQRNQQFERPFEFRHGGHDTTLTFPTVMVSPAIRASSPLTIALPGFRADRKPAISRPSLSVTWLCKNAAGYNRTRNFGLYGHAESKKTQKFVFRSALRPNQISFSHGQVTKTVVTK